MSRQRISRMAVLGIGWLATALAALAAPTPAEPASSATPVATHAREVWTELVGTRFASDPAFVYVENDPALPNVLIYGDSISIGYTPRVRKQLAGKANVYRIYTNGSDSGAVIPRLQLMHDKMRDPKLTGHWTFEWDVILFNVGLHDLKYMNGRKLDKVQGQQVRSVADYAENIRKIVAYLKDLAPGAKLIFITTTPVPEGESGRVASDELRYNAAALQALKDFPEVGVLDLHAFTLPRQPEWWTKPGNVHFNDEGQKAQGDAVAQAIARALEAKKP